MAGPPSTDAFVVVAKKSCYVEVQMAWRGWLGSSGATSHSFAQRTQRDCPQWSPGPYLGTQQRRAAADVGEYLRAAESAASIHFRLDTGRPTPMLTEAQPTP